MPRRTSAALAALTLAGLALLTGCNGGDPAAAGPGAPSPRSSGAATASTPTASPTTVSPAQQNAELAEKAVARFWAMSDQLLINPSLTLNKFATVARGQALTQWRTTIFVQRKRGWKQIGNSSIVSSFTRPSNGRKYEVTSCIDVSKVNIVDKQGKSVVGADRPPQTQNTYVVEATSDGWFVIRDLFRVKPC